MNRSPMIAMAIVTLITTSTNLHAQLTESQRVRLIDDMRASAEQLDASRLPDLESSQQEFLRRVGDLQQYLERVTSVENRDAWLTYLKVDPLIEAIDSGASPGAKVREAQSLQARLIGIYPGLEVDQVRLVRDAVNQLIPAIRYRDREKSIDLVSRQLSALAKRFEELESVPSIDDAAASNLILGILGDSNQDVPVVGTLRELYSRPNVRVRLGESLVQELLNRNIDEYQPVTDCILGTRIQGIAHFVGSATTELLPADNAVRMRITVTGQAVSNNIGYRKPVRLRTQGFAGLCITRTVTATESDVTYEPTYVDVNLKTKINAIEHRSRLVRRIAWRKAAETKAMADRIATERMRNQLRDQFDRDTREQASAAPDPMGQLRPILQRLELPEPSRDLSSTDDAILLRSLFRRSDQVGSAVAPPPLPTAHNAVVQLHESAIDNALSHLLAGRSVNENQINKLIADLGREVPPEDKDEPPFVIDFASVRPVVFEARGDSLRMGIRCNRFSQGRSELKDIIITAIYRPETKQGRVILVREGNVRIDFPNRRRLTMGQVGIRRIIVENFSDIFPPVLLERPLKIPSDFRLKALRDREIVPKAISAIDGWLTLAAD